MALDMQVGDIIRYSVAVWKPGAQTKARAFRRSDISHHREIVGRVERMTRATVWVRPMDGGDLVRSSIRSMKGFENRSHLSKRAGWFVDQLTGELSQSEESRKLEEESKKREWAEVQVSRWKATLCAYGEDKARQIAKFHLDSDTIIDRILRRAV